MERVVAAIEVTLATDEPAYSGHQTDLRPRLSPGRRTVTYGVADLVIDIT